jgi:hypothetical protein
VWGAQGAAVISWLIWLAALKSAVGRFLVLDGTPYSCHGATHNLSVPETSSMA